jgi:nucleoside-diphosphate-sugar epimerase
MLKNLVIGSDGFIGKPFCKYLESQGEAVVRFDIKRNKKEDGRTFNFDFKDIDRVYFLAWDVGGSKYLFDSKIQMSQLKWNLELMTNVFNHLEKSKKKFLFVSSQFADDCSNVYGVTKRLGEVWTKELGGVCVRVWNAYGVMEEKDIKSHVISDFIYKALEDKKIEMMTSGEEWRQFTHVKDLSRAFHMALNGENIRRTVYDASSYEWIRVLDVARIISEITDAKLLPGKTKGNDPLPAQNMGRVPGWLPTIEFREGLERMVEEAEERINNGKRE